jgi:hypothetical protein
MRLLLALALLVGCAPVQPDAEAGRSFAIQSELYGFSDAWNGAEQHCTKMGLRAEPGGTYNIGIFTPHGGTLSWFDCVERSAFQPSS